MTLLVPVTLMSNENFNWYSNLTCCVPGRAHCDLVRQAEPFLEANHGERGEHGVDAAARSLQRVQLAHVSAYEVDAGIALELRVCDDVEDADFALASLQ